MKKLAFNLFILFSLIILAYCGGNSKKEENTEVKTEKVEVAKTDEEKVEEIKNKFYEIESNKALKMKQLFYQNPNPDLYYDQAEYDAYYQGDKLLKIRETRGEEGYMAEKNYYFENAKLFFVFKQYYFMDNLYQEERIYLDQDEKVIKALIKSKDAEDQTKDIATMKNEEDPEFTSNKTDYNLQFREYYLGMMECFKNAK